MRENILKNGVNGLTMDMRPHLAKGAACDAASVRKELRQSTRWLC